MKIISADLLLPISSPPIKNSSILIKEGKIWEISSRKSLKKNFPKALEFYFPLVMPCLINAHTHLELSGLSLIREQESFTHWLLQLIEQKRHLLDPLEVEKAFRREIREQIKTGVCALGDVVSELFIFELHQKSPFFSTAFFELIDPKESTAGAHLKTVKQIFERFHYQLGNTLLGLIPHTPYTASLSVYQQAQKFSREHHLGFCTHLAESPEEVEFLQTGTGKIVDLLYPFVGWGELQPKPKACSPAEYLKDLINENMTLVHCVEISDSDLEIIAKARAVVHCPRSNLHLTGKLAPVPKMLEAGIPVGLGTDSPASAGDSNLWNEMKKVYELRKEYPGRELKPSEILKMATTFGARAIFREKELGSIEKGKIANLLCLNLKPLPTKLENLAKAIISAGSSAISSVFLAGEPQALPRSE